jgi:anti-anti-sigma factor
MMSTSIAAHVPPPSLNLRIYKTEEATVVGCSGRLTFDFTTTLKSEVKSLIPQSKRIVLDFTDLKFMDSSGLGAIVSLYVSAKKAGCELGLINFNKQIRELLGITHVLSVFESFGQYNARIP